MYGLTRISGIVVAGVIAASASLSPAYAALVAVGGTEATNVWAGLTPGDSTSLPTGAVWNPDRTPASGSSLTPPEYRSPWEGSSEPGTKFWTIGYNASGPNYPNPAVLNFDADHNEISFLWGSVDAYNSISFYGTGGFIETYTGAMLLAAFPQVTSGLGAALVSIVVSGFNEIRFSSSNNAFELSNITVSDSETPRVPLPSAILLLGSVVGGLGMFGAMRRKGQAAA